MATPQVIDDILQRAEALYQRGEFVAASQLLCEGISEAPSAGLWNDWAAVQVSLGQLQDAEGGFRAALPLVIEMKAASQPKRAPRPDRR